MSSNVDVYDDDLLRHYYELELEVLRRDMLRFAQRRRDAAARLSINSDGHSDEQGVERLVQSTALLHARHRLKIDDDYPEFAEALTHLSYPQYLRPFPSCAIAQFNIDGLFDSVKEPLRISRGTDLWTHVENCRFRTAYDVVLAPLRIAALQYVSTPSAPGSVRLPPDISGMLSVTFRSATPDGRLDAAMPASLRVHLAGQLPVVATLMDTMLLRTTSAFVEDSAGRWTSLPAIPVTAAGFGPQDWLCTDERETGQSFGILAECFAFAQRFHFVDIDCAALRVAASGQTLTLHLAVDRIAPDSWASQQLAHLNADHFKLFCTPVVNLFDKRDLTLKYDPHTDAWPFEVQGRDDALTEVWSVDRVRIEQGPSLSSAAAFTTRCADDALPRWALTQSNGQEAPGVGGRAALVLVAADGGTAGAAALGSLRADVMCTNGDVPRKERCGAAEGDMRMDGPAPVKRVTLLQAPTAVAQLSRTNGALWRFIGQRTPQPVRLSQAGLPGLKQLLQQFATLSPVPARHIDGVTALSHRSVMTMVARPPQPAMVRGIEITLEIDEPLFAGHSIAVFARVMERFFAPYAHRNSFVQLCVVSGNGARLWSGAPLTGASPVL